MPPRTDSATNDDNRKKRTTHLAPHHHARTIGSMETPPDKSPNTGSEVFNAASQRFFESIGRLRDVAKMQATLTWPRRPFLCLRHRTLRENGLPKLGLLYEHAEGKVQPIVYGANLHEIGTTITNEAEFGSRALDTYASFDELASDGWVVD